MDRSDSDGARYTVESYFALADRGLLGADDHVELLDGIIVAEPPQDPRHATAVNLVVRALQAVIGENTTIRVQQPLLLGGYSAPEPDVAVVAGDIADYSSAHPRCALLVVEVAQSSLPKDRLSKSRIYAAAGIPEYWLVNLRDGCLEIFRRPDPSAALYADRSIATADDDVRAVAIDAGRPIRVTELIPR